jgi:hypothetical protein
MQFFLKGGNEMGRSIGISIVTILMLLFAVVLPNSIAKSVKPTKEGILDLIENDLWGNIVGEGARGKLKFNVEGPNFNFDFKGTGLEPHINYVLIRSLEPETILPYKFEVIAEEISDEQGNLFIAGSYNFNLDLNSAEFLLVPEYMLVLPDNGRGRPGKYLTGQGLIGYNDTDTGLRCGCQSSGTNFDLSGISKGEKAIDFTLESTAGDEFALYEFQGKENKPVVLIFGAYT